MPSGTPFVVTLSFSGSIANIPGLPSEDESPAGLMLEDFTGFYDFWLSTYNVKAGFKF